MLALLWWPALCKTNQPRKGFYENSSVHRGCDSDHLGLDGVDVGGNSKLGDGMSPQVLLRDVRDMALMIAVNGHSLGSAAESFAVAREMLMVLHGMPRWCGVQARVDMVLARAVRVRGGVEKGSYGNT
jgi:hypothetical protein